MAGPKAFALIAMFIAVCFAAPAYSQSFSEFSSPAEITVIGSVVDQSAAAIPGVTASLSGPAGTSRSTTTKTDGTFSFEGVLSGTYVLTAEISGFETRNTVVVIHHRDIRESKCR